MAETKARRRPWRWIWRGALGVAALLALAVVAALIAAQTPWGRERMRAEVERRLAAAFTGGASLGAADGSPLGELILHDLVINGPEGRPAITVRTLAVELAVLPLLSHQARVRALRAEDVDVALRRDARGELAIKRLMRPGPRSAWSVDLPSVAIRRGHVRIDTGAEPMNLDGVMLDGRAKLPSGGPIDAEIDLRATWRERAAGLKLHAVVRSDERGLALPVASARADGVSVLGTQLMIAAAGAGGARGATRARAIGGTLVVEASAAGVARLLPTVHLPADVWLRVTATPTPGQPWTRLAATGRVDRTAVRFTGAADLAARHVRGELSTGTLDVGRLSGGRIAGSAAATAVFDVRRGGAGSATTLPIATATIRGWGELAGAPRATLAITLSSVGESARGTIEARGDGLRADLEADLRVAGERVAIEGATLHATVADPARASGGKAPVRGALRIDLTARGALRPAPSLAVTGTIDGRDLRTPEVSVAALHAAIDARRLPDRPFGRARVELVDLVRGGVQLGALTAFAADRPDGRIAVAVRSRPRQAPWRIEADALVTPPGPPGGAGAGRVAIDLVRHHVRAGSGADWTGRTGHLDIGPDRIVLRDLASASAAGRLAIAASYERAGRRRGDLTAELDARSLALDDLARAYRGTLDAHAWASRRGGAWQGELALDGKGVALEPTAPAASGHARAALHGRRLTVTADAAGPQLGRAGLALDVEAPAHVTDPDAWQRLGRGAIRTAELTLRGIDVRGAARLAGLTGDYAGRIDGELRLSPSAITGRIAASRVIAPPWRGLPVTAVLALPETAPGELAPALTVTVEGAGGGSVGARLAIPERLFDPAAWRRLGRGALRGATVRVPALAVDPAMLERLGIASDLRGRLGVAIDVGRAARTVAVVVDAGELRGGPIVQPIDAHLTAAVDDRATTAALTASARGARLIALTGRIPASLSDLVLRMALEGDARSLRATPLAATAKLSSVDAGRLAAVFGRGEVTGGRIDGSIRLGGTLGAPAITADLVAAGLRVPPGPHGAPVRTLERLAITGSWAGGTARLDLDGVESGGGTLRASALIPAARRGGRLAIRAAKFDLAPVLAFIPGPAGDASGRLDADLTVTGLDPRTARIAGELHLTGARIPTAPTVGTLRDATLDAAIADREVRLRAGGKLGAGSVSATGTIALDGAVPRAGRANIALREVSPIGSIEPRITADVAATLSREGERWRAELVVDRGTVVVPSDRGEKLKPVGAPPDMMFAGAVRAGRRPPPPPASPSLVAIIIVRSTRVESDEFRGLVRGRVELRAGGGALALVGGIEADRGDLDLFGRRYRVERAGVHFDGSLDPLLDVRITHDFSEVTTVTEVHGRASKPELAVSSDPATYSRAQLLGFLLGGEPGGAPTGSASERATAAGESLVASQIGRYVRRALPIDVDVLRYEAATATTSAAVTVGTWITPSLFVAYRQHLASGPLKNAENTGEAELEYWLSRRLVIEGTVGDRGYSGADLLWRKRY